MGSAINDLLGGGKAEKPKKENYIDPWADELRTRLMGHIDQYLRKNGVTAFVPRERWPYEWRSDSERAAIADRQSRDENGNKIEPQKPDPYSPLLPVDVRGEKPAEAQMEDQADVNRNKDELFASLMADRVEDDPKRPRKRASAGRLSPQEMLLNRDRLTRVFGRGT